MRAAQVRRMLRLSLFLCGCVVGCVTTNPSATTPLRPPDPLVEALLKQEPLVFKKDNGVEVKTDPPQVKPDLVLKEVPLQTPLAEARAVLERHGFSCQGGVKDNFQTCLYCTAYRLKTPYIADRVVVKVYYEEKRVVNVAVTVENGVKRGTGLWPEF